MRLPITIAALGTLSLALAACNGDKSMAVGESMPNGATASATLHTPDGKDVGTARATDVAGGIRYTLDVRGLPAGTHGAHIHTTGRCDAPEFTTAGGHWNPTAHKHGSMNPAGPHEGDLPNLMVGSDGRGTIGVTVPGGTIATLLDADGAAIVVHAGPDDLMSDPAGNSGGRIACGIFAAS